MAENKSNYEIWCDQWRERFLKLDIDVLKQRLPELEDLEDMLSIQHFGRKFGIQKSDGIILPLEDNEDVSCYEQLNIYTLFGYVQPLAHLKNEWVKFEKLKDTAPFEKAFVNGITLPLARMFDGKSEKLRQAFEHLGARRIDYSDVGYEWDAFRCIPIRFLFWEGDDEFSSQTNILFDASATDFIHGESVVTIAAVALAKIAAEANVPLDRSAMPAF